MAEICCCCSPEHTIVTLQLLLKNAFIHGTFSLQSLIKLNSLKGTSLLNNVMEKRKELYVFKCLAVLALAH